MRHKTTLDDAQLISPCILALLVPHYAMRYIPYYSDNFQRCVLNLG